MLTDAAMSDPELVSFLQRVLPGLRLRWEGFRKVRGQVRKRLARRLAALGLADLDAYERWLESHPDERAVLDELCRITISRFYRDRGVWDALATRVVPLLLERDTPLRAWSAGCASGEEPYTLALLWHLELAPHHAGARLEVLGTDANPRLLERAARACYPRGALRELPAGWSERAFEPAGEELCLRAACRVGVRFEARDLRAAMPDGPFQLILCRNLAFTYFAPELQREVLARLLSRLAADGCLVIGCHERVPAPAPLTPLPGAPSILRRA